LKLTALYTNGPDGFPTIVTDKNSISEVFNSFDFSNLETLVCELDAQNFLSIDFYKKEGVKFFVRSNRNTNPVISNYQTNDKAQERILKLRETILEAQKDKQRMVEQQEIREASREEKRNFGYHSIEQEKTIEIISIKDDKAQFGFVLIEYKDFNSNDIRVKRAYNGQDIPETLKTGDKVVAEPISLNSGLDLKYPVIYLNID